MNDFDALLFKEKKSRNEYLEEGKIPLGYRTYHHKYFASDEVVTMDETFGSNSTLIIGTPRAGKTVIAKNIWFWKAYFFSERYKKKRTIVSLDAEGTEWHLCKFPNPRPEGLFRQVFGHQGIGVKDLISFSPCFSGSEINQGDLKYTLYPADLHLRSWNCLGVDRGYIISEAVRKGHADIQSLRKHMLELPTSKKEAEAQGETYYIHPQIYNKMNQILDNLEEDNFFTPGEMRMSKKLILEKMREGNHLNFNFFGEMLYPKVYGGVILENLYNLRAEGNTSAPCVFIEEADNMCKRGDSETPSARMMIKGIRRGGKHGWDVNTITQRLNSLHEDVSDFSKNMIIGGNLTASDMKRLSQLVHPNIVNAVKNIRFNPMKGIREFVLVGADRKYYQTFRSFNCPVATYEEKRELIT